MKRFYKAATVGAGEGGHTVLLDDRPIRTPGKRLLAMPERRLALAVAGEWQAQGETIRPDSMPLTRLVNTVVDQMPARRHDAMVEILDYAASDLLCYRHASPADLALRQTQAWQPWLDWAGETLGCHLVATTELEPIPQPAASLAALERAADSLDDWRLTGLHATTRLTGSVILGMAMVRGTLTAELALELAELEQLFEIERWGLEAEQARRHAVLRAELAATELYVEALRPHSERDDRGIIA